MIKIIYKNATLAVGQWILITFGWLALVSANAAENPMESEFLLFPTVHFEHRSNMEDGSDLDDKEFEPAVSVFYTAKKNNWNVLAEVFLSEEEQEFERILVGLTIKESNVLWLGRFHNPIGYWNLNNHHGSFLSTTVHRPAIVEFEDDGGIIPTHVTGLLMQGSTITRSSEVKYNIGFGLGPSLSEDGLEAFETFQFEDDDHKPTFTAHVSYSPDGLGQHEMGAFYNINEIKSELSTLERVDQQVVGMFYHANLMPYTFSVSVFNISYDMQQNNGTQSSSFSNIFLLLERQFYQSWTVYASRDYSDNEDDDPYIALIPAFVSSRSSVGLRYDFLENQAITFEVANMDTGLGDHVHSTIQWSAVFP